MASNLASCDLRTLFGFYRRLGMNLLRDLLGRRAPHYLVMTPPCMKEQIVRTTRTKEKRRFAIRDQIDLAVLKQIFVTEDYDIGRLTRSSDIFATYEKIVASGNAPLIVDCGANIGLSSVYFSEKFPRAKIVALEPEANNYALAQRNCPAENVEFLLSAIASDDTTGELIDPGLGGWGFRVRRRNDGPIQMISINSLLNNPKYRECEPLIVKIDIEGFEKELFSKNTEWVDKFPLLVIELHDWMLPRERNSADFLSVIAKLDRDFVYIGQNVFSISNRLR
jgi:FkbM family methyltransferase